MDKYTANTLIANAGLHFKTVEIEINSEEPLVLPDGKTLKYTFLESVDFLDGGKLTLDVCTCYDGKYIPVNYMKCHDLIAMSGNGLALFDTSGVLRLKKDTSVELVENYASGSPELMSINSLSSLRLKKNQTIVTGFELLQGKWLPMPMYELEENGQSTGYPNGWCRVRIDPIGKKLPNGKQRFRLVWAFDTRLAENEDEEKLRPVFLEGSGERKQFSLCNRVDLMFGDFLNIPDGQNDAPVGDYLAALMGIDLQEDVPHKYKFLVYYVYLVNYLRLSGAAPEVVLYNKTERQIPVDMSVDIGNSRTCAMLFEEGKFDKARTLRLTDLSCPWLSYENAFDMRIVFRRADFGGDITQDRNLFLWPSLVRVGEEATRLVYRSLENNGEAERTTNYSSPKRYLWDDRPYEHRWEMLVMEEDSTAVKVSPQIFVEGLTDYFDDDGTYLEMPKEFDLFSFGETDNSCHYSRQSLMTFVMMEMLQQAFCYINSSKFRFMHGEIDCQRYLRNIIVTCPTAMPLKEQEALRRSALSATKLFKRLNPSFPAMTVIPHPDLLVPTDDMEAKKHRGWLFDEAFASQLVYLYSEIAERYDGKSNMFFQLKGHARKDMQERGFEGNSLTIGTIDIGAGTTDVMVTAYGRQGTGRLRPVPLFYDSFYTAGDDILHNIIRDVVLEGKDNEADDLGSIGSSLATRIEKMGVDELLSIPRIAETKRYKEIVDDIRLAMSEQEVLRLKGHLTQELMHHFFDDQSAGQSAKDRRCRLDFCTQVSHPISQFFLELLKQGRPTRVYTYQELFPKNKPSAYLLDHFEYHFGFRFEELNWRFDPQEIGDIVRDTMEPLIKVLSVVMYAHHCDILVLSGRPTNLKPLTELFLKYMPIAPHRLVLLNEYRVGRWFPLATEEGYFQESQKAVVAVGAEVGYLASTSGFNGLVLDFSSLAMDMESTARYFGALDESQMEVKEPFLTPEKGSVTLKDVSIFPYYIGCKQFDAPKYQARPLYAIYNNSGIPQLNLLLQRNYYEDREQLILEDVSDMEGESVSTSQVEVRLQTLGGDGCFWMDKGAFTLKIHKK